MLLLLIDMEVEQRARFVSRYLIRAVALSVVLDAMKTVADRYCSLYCYTLHLLRKGGGRKWAVLQHRRCIGHLWYFMRFLFTLLQVPFPQKRNTLDYAFFKKYNYWISTIHGQFSLKFFLNHNIHHLNAFQHHFQKISPWQCVQFDPNVLFWGGRRT